MTSDEAEGRLRALITAAGVDLENPTTADVARTWEAVRAAFAEKPDDIDPAPMGDGLLAQYGVYAFTGDPVYELDITRQLAFLGEDGGFGYMTQLHCAFIFAPTAELEALDAWDLWSWDSEDFFADALAAPGFRIVAERGLVPLRLEISTDDV
jgi:hypothetical protein